jgi:hypothetical protein
MPQPYQHSQSLLKHPLGLENHISFPKQHTRDQSNLIVIEKLVGWALVCEVEQFLTEAEGVA